MMVSFVGRGQWRYRTHKMITLPEMFWDWKHQCTATEVYFWYTHALKRIKKKIAFQGAWWLARRSAAPSRRNGPLRLSPGTVASRWRHSQTFVWSPRSRWRFAAQRIAESGWSDFPSRAAASKKEHLWLTPRFHAHTHTHAHTRTRTHAHTYIPSPRTRRPDQCQRCVQIIVVGGAYKYFFAGGAYK